MRRLVLSLLLVFLSLALQANPYSGDVGLVIIDPGHGGRDPGAVSGTLLEKDLTLSISRKLASELEDRGFSVMLTRDDDSYLELQERCDAANGADFELEDYPVFISIHINSSTNSSASGFEVYVRQSGRDVAMLGPGTSDKLALKYSSYTNRQLNDYEHLVSSRLAELVCMNFEDVFEDIPMRGVKSGDLWVLNATWMPSILVEVGFISNGEEAARMASGAFQNALVDVIASAIEEL